MRTISQLSMPRCELFLALFLKIGLNVLGMSCRRPHRFAMIVDGQAGHMQAHQTAVGLLEDDDGDGAAFDACAERDFAAAGQAGRDERLNAPLRHVNSLPWAQRVS